MAKYQVKGSTLRSKFDYVHERFGDQALERLERRFANKKLFPILHSGWYPYELYVAVLEAIAEHHFDGNLAQLVDVGAHSAKVALSTVYAAFVRPTGFVEFLQGMSRLHHMFYSLGEIEVTIDEGMNRAEIVQRDKPTFADADLYVASGFYQKAADLHGLEGVACGFSLEADGAHFDLSWE